MNHKEWLLVPLFEKFIKESYQGKRLKADGTRIKKQTIKNYEYVLVYLKGFETESKQLIRIKQYKGLNKRLFQVEKNYWRKFYNGFTQYLYRQHKCYDNYVGTVIKSIRIFFNWLNREKGIQTGEFYKSFYVCREEIPIVTLLPQQLQMLISNEEFNAHLTAPLQKAKSIFVFGCTVGLRVGDLFNIKFNDIEKTGGFYYLPVKTEKTGTNLRIKLPEHAIQIIKVFKESARNRKTIFPPIPRTRFNNQLKQIAEAAGWTAPMNKTRSRRGVGLNIIKKNIQTGEVINQDSDKIMKTNQGNTSDQYRFCDLVSSHTMRRTAITTMLMMGMQEHVVKQISGHAQDSKSFYRYVNLVQSHLDNEMEKVYDRLKSFKYSS